MTAHWRYSLQVNTTRRLLIKNYVWTIGFLLRNSLDDIFYLNELLFNGFELHLFAPKDFFLSIRENISVTIGSHKFIELK